MPHSATVPPAGRAALGPLRRRLLTRAEEAGVPLGAMLTRYVHAAFLRRLQRSSQSANLGLRGAGLLAQLLPEGARYTENLDLQQNHERLAVNVGALHAALAELGRPPAGEPADPLRWQPESSQSQTRKTAWGYTDLRLCLPVYLGPTRCLLQLHVAPQPAASLPLAALPEPPWMADFFPPLTGLKPLRATTAEQLVAEKLHVLHVHQNPGVPPLRRLQDLWDLNLVAEHLPLAGGPLLAAIRAVFEHRQTRLPQAAAEPLRDPESEDAAPADSGEAATLRARWAHFQRRCLPQRAAGPPARPALVALLRPVYAALRQQHGMAQRWRPERGWGE